MKFDIYPGRPKLEDKIIGNASDLSEAIEMCFSPNEDAILTLNGISVRISYKYDLGIICDDIISLLGSCFKKENFTIYFGSNSFNSEWNISCIDNEIILFTTWDSASGYLESVLDKVGSISIEKEVFITNWVDLIRVCLDGVKKSGILVEDKELIREAEGILKSINF